MTPTAKELYKSTLATKNRIDLRKVKSHLMSALFILDCNNYDGATYAVVRARGQPCADIWTVVKAIEEVLDAEIPNDPHR